jgi:hypothetical protein
MMKRVAMAVAAATTVAAVWAGTAVGLSGSQRFTLRFTGSGGGGGTVYAAGPISGTGSDVVINDNTDRFVFTGGSVTVTHQTTNSSDSFDPRSCRGTHRETGNYQIAGGTGKYAGASGNGTYSLWASFRSTRTASGCSHGGESGTGVVTARGTTSLP